MSVFTSGTVATRQNYALNPLATESAGFGQYNPGVGEAGSTAYLTGQSDGPIPQIQSYARRSITAPKTSGSTGWIATSANQRAPKSGLAGAQEPVSVWVRYTGPGTLVGTMRASAHTAAGASAGIGDSTPYTLQSGQWTLVSSVVTASEAYASVGWWFYQFASAGSIAPAGSTLDATGLMVGDGEVFAGSFPATADRSYAWTGPVNASPSIAYPTPGLRVEGFTDAPCPRVGITLDGLATTGPSRVTLWRSTPGGQRRKVRGWDKRIVYGSDYAIDYETPLGRPVRYDLVVDTGPTVPLRVSDTVTLDTDTGFIQDPLQPLGAIALAGNRDGDTTTVMSPAFKNLEYQLDGSTVAIMGSREPVALTGQRLIAAGIDFSMVTRAAEQGTRLRNLFLDTPIVLVRPLPEWGDLPDLIYTAPAVTEKQFDTSIGGEKIAWTIVGDSVRPPSINVLVALWTYDQVAALWSTYASAQAAATATAARYLDVQRDPTMGV